jgi:hypothetical protein
MADIFDEVDEILSDVDSTVDETVAEVESNFNESELQDIMAEIESLEQEFVTDEAEPVVAKTQLQEAIEKELEMSQDVSPEVKEEIIAPASVLNFGKKVETAAPVKTAPVTTSKSSEISFAANGQMNLNLSFKVGEETATLTVDPVLGLIVTMKGVELSINELDGCKVTMENGVNFTIPLTAGSSTSKKKAA